MLTFTNFCPQKRLSLAVWARERESAAVHGKIWILLLSSQTSAASLPEAEEVRGKVGDERRVWLLHFPTGRRRDSRLPVDSLLQWLVPQRLHSPNCGEGGDPLLQVPSLQQQEGFHRGNAEGTISQLYKSLFLRLLILVWGVCPRERRRLGDGYEQSDS